MAASMLGRRTAVLCRTLSGISSYKAVLSVNSRCGFLLQTASYNPKPLKLNITQPYIPDKDSEKTPEWQKTARYDNKLFGRYGSASGIDPASLWPTHEQLDKIIAEEKQWNPPLEVLVANVKVKEREETNKRLAKEKLIAENMAKMPKMIEDWRRQKRESKQKQKEEKARRTWLLAQAKERFGVAIDPRSPKFLQMVAEVEKEEKMRRRLLKRKMKEEKMAALTTPPLPPPPPAAAAAAASS